MTWTRPLLLAVAAADPQRLVELVLNLREEKAALQRRWRTCRSNCGKGTRN